MTDSSPKSRLPRTGTLVLIAVVLLIGCGMLMVWLPYHREQQAIAEIERLGGTTQSHRVRPAPRRAWQIIIERQQVWEVDLHDTQVSDAAMEQLRFLPHVEQLLLYNTQVRNVGLENLRGLSKLKNLSLDNTQVGDAGMVHLRELTKLVRLSLDDTQVTDAGLEHLQRLPMLERLHLNNTQISDAGLEHLRGVTTLGSLFINDSKVTQAGIDKLQKTLPNCYIHWTPRTPPSK